MAGSQPGLIPHAVGVADRRQDIESAVELERQPPDRPARILVDSGVDIIGSGIQTEDLPVCDQYTIQGDLFSKAVTDGGEVPTPLEDSLRNMAVIEALYRSSAENAWVAPDIGTL